MTSWVTNAIFVVTICILLSVSKTSCWRLTTRKTTEIYIGLNSDGSLTDSSSGPRCSDGEKMVLLSYSYHRMECPFHDDCKSVHEEMLLPAEKLLLHQKCSMREECVDLKFPLRSASQRNSTNAVYIQYQCKDGKSFLNMCGNYTRSIKDVFYLTVFGTQWPFDQCLCFVNSRGFRMTLSDIRLLDRTKGECCRAEVGVNDRTITCDETEEGFGSVFNDHIQEPMHNLFLSLLIRSRATLPDTILVTIKPEMSVKVTCEGKHPVPLTTSLSVTETTETTPEDPPYLHTTPAEKTQDNEKSLPVEINDLCQRFLYLHITSLVLLLAILIMILLRNRIEKRNVLRRVLQMLKHKLILRQKIKQEKSRKEKTRGNQESIPEPVESEQFSLCAPVQEESDDEIIIIQSDVTEQTQHEQIGLRQISKEGISTPSTDSGYPVTDSDSELQGSERLHNYGLDSIAE